MKIIVIAIGGAVGAVLRYLVSLLVISQMGDSWPYGTLAVNLIGFLWQLFETITYADNMRLLIFTGGLGAFTTFSTFGCNRSLPPSKISISVKRQVLAMEELSCLAAVGQ
ncbi:Fluoride ion transporter CrcB [hydrothermal vent metagenome]|uniref:Fluoride ion transporter CrcB n=1 Tax=hydrothermal vent metagenome TaxID=652676 RepID=A0A3B0VV60_9ZZZZ